MSTTDPTTTTTTTPVPPPTATKAEVKDGIVWRFEPANDGEYLQGIPQRALTQADVDALTVEQQRDALHPGPSGKPMYVEVDPPKDKE